jgi:hypothetical protein
VQLDRDLVPSIVIAKEVRPQDFINIGMRDPSRHFETAPLPQPQADFRARAGREKKSLEKGGLAGSIVADDDVDAPEPVEMNGLERAKILYLERFDHAIPGAAIAVCRRLRFAVAKKRTINHQPWPTVKQDVEAPGLEARRFACTLPWVAFD